MSGTELLRINQGTGEERRIGVGERGRVWREWQRMDTGAEDGEGGRGWRDRVSVKAGSGKLGCSGVCTGV